LYKRNFWYASPSGSPQGDGSIGNPWDLTTALNLKDHSLPNGVIQPGDVLFLRGGRYQSPGPYLWWPTLTGAPGLPITVRSYPGDTRPALDLMNFFDSFILDNPARAGNTLGHNVHDVDFWDIEWYSSTIARTSAFSGNNGMPNGLIVEGQNIRLIHPYIHDLGDFASFAVASNNLIYGAISMDHGWLAPDRGHGHLLYVENDDSNGSVKQIQNSFFINCYDAGVQEFGTAALTRAIQFQGNTVANAGGAKRVNNAQIQWMIGQNRPTQIVADSNVFYTSPDLGSGYVEAGWQWDTQNGTLQFTNNYVIGPALEVTNWDQAVVRGNHIYPRNADVSFYLYSNASPPQGFANWSVDENVYGAGNFISGQRRLDANFNPITSSSTQAVPSPWQTTISGDAHSTFNAAPSNVVLVNPSTFIAGRVHITIWNPSGTAAVPLDLSAANLADGDAFELRDVQNIDGPAVVKGIYSAASPAISAPATGLVRKVMIGESSQPEHTAPYLLTFVLLSGDALSGRWGPLPDATPILRRR
jgi:hypothetical protein